MKRTNARVRFNSSVIPGHVEEIALGTISAHETTNEPMESTVIMSERNFRHLVDMIPKSNHNALNNDIQSIKDKLTQLTMSSSLTRQSIVDLLNDQVNRQSFLADVEELNSTPMIVGKIDLNDMV